MVHYIRLLKPPKHNPHPKTPSVTTLLTVTTDLGDTFLPADARLTATLVSCKGENSLVQKQLSWTAGSRQLNVSLPLSQDVNFALQRSGVRLVISESGSSSESGTVHERIPRIVSAWSAPFGGENGGEAERIVQRRIGGKDREGEVKIWEELGDSIALHVWDAALACMVYFRRAAEGHAGSMTALREAFRGRSTGDDGGKPRELKVIEVGTGCGAVGISLAQMLRKCNVLLTDLPAAGELVSRNLSVSQPAEGSTLGFRVLDWERDDERGDFYEFEYNMIVVSDCIYNPDNIPALVRVLGWFVSTASPGAMVLVAWKRRHESEKMFFELMEKAGFFVQEQDVVLLPSLQEMEEDEAERVEMYVYRWKDDRG